MKTKGSIAILLMITSLFSGIVGSATIALGQAAPKLTNITVPSSSVANPGDAGVRVHTNVRILGAGELSGAPQTIGPPFSKYFYETPASIACIYELQPSTAGCNPNVVSQNPSGGSGAIAIVDAYDDPNAYIDLQNFSTQFGIAPITPSSFTVVYAPSARRQRWPRPWLEPAPVDLCTGAAGPPESATGTGCGTEESLDIEYAHAMAPSATLYLVEAQSNSYTDLVCAIRVANDLVTKAGGGEVSMSWGSSEFSDENAIDAEFTAPKVVYLAAAGDAPGVLYPSASPNVIAVGGTSLSTNCETGGFELENTWQESGGGVSAYEVRPSYQDGIASVVGARRGTPDVSVVANPYTGVWVLDSLELGFGNWYVVGGTSLATAVMAGIVNAANGSPESSLGELAKLYKNSFEFNDIVVGDCGECMGIFATAGWDFCSRLGSPRGYSGK